MLYSTKCAAMLASVGLAFAGTNTQLMANDTIGTAVEAGLVKTLSAAAYEAEPQVLFEFSEADAGRKWQTVNDGVMGGRSDGRIRITEEGRMEFFGTLSLENNGGFASVRSKPRELDLQEGDTLVARVKGDGRRYTLNLYVPRRRMAFSYRLEFQTKKEEWIEVRAPLQDFVATSFGRIVSNAGSVEPQQINSVGFLLGDKKPGPFKLEIDWIRGDSAR